MLVTKILRELDAELERLQTARDTIASLIAPASTTTPVPPARKTVNPAKVAFTSAPVQVPQVETVQEQAPALELAPARRRGRPKGSVNRRPAVPRMREPRLPEPTALARSIAAGPVFVSAAELDRQRQRAVLIAAPKPAEMVPSEGTLEALIREVAERRTSAAA